MIRLITFATDNFSISAERLKATALRHGVDQVEIYTPSRLHFLFFDHLFNVDFTERGAGWWIWKPFICLHALITMHDENDVLIYCDAGTEIVDDVSHVIRCMDEDVFLFSNGWQHSHWCKKEVAQAILGENWYGEQKQVQASAIFFKVTERSKKLIQRWYAWSVMPGMIDNTPRGPQFPEFQEHRHDQAILTCLQIKYGHKLHWFPSTMNHHQDRMGDPYPQIFNHHRRRNDEY